MKEIIKHVEKQYESDLNSGEVITGAWSFDSRLVRAIHAELMKRLDGIEISYDGRDDDKNRADIRKSLCEFTGEGEKT